MSSKISLICIFCPPKSGSTLLEILLGTHQKISSIGERRFEDNKCNCGKTLQECDFWSKIKSKSSSKNIFEILSKNKNDINFNKEIFKLMLNESNSLYVLESMKSSIFIDKCRQYNEDFDVKIISLIRDPMELIQIQKKKRLINNFKKGSNVLKTSIFIFYYYLKQLRYLKNTFHITYYNDLIDNPLDELNKIYEKLNLPLIKNLHVDKSKIHSLGGSGVRNYDSISKNENLNYLSYFEKIFANILSIPSWIMMKFILLKKK